MFGSHLSIAGSMSNALLEAERLGMDTVQVFTKNQQQWRAPALADSCVREWTGHLERLCWRGRTVSHASYLINLASPSDELWAKSVDLMTVEVERCEVLAIPFLVHHPGSPVGTGAELGMARIADAYRELFRRTRGLRTVCCLENTVGAGSTLGGRFEELGDLRRRILDTGADPQRVGFCFDTCHAHAAGYDFSGLEGAQAVLAEFDGCCGLQHLQVFHVNDSKAQVGSHLDRHAHIGEGTIGKRGVAQSGFAAVIGDPRFAAIPKILETPKGKNKAGTDLDALNLRRLRKLVGGYRPIERRRRAQSAAATPARRARQAVPS